LIYLVTGLVQLILVFALLGIVSWLPRQDPPPRHQSQVDRAGLATSVPAGTATEGGKA
jgi:hypothetical protein